MQLRIGMTLTPTKMRRIRGRLEAHRFALLARYRAELERADEQTAMLGAEPVEAATEQWETRVLSVMSELDGRALESVTAALRRVDTGIYGTCAVCWEPIDARRLDALPEATACRECMKAAEKTIPRRAFSVAMSR
jgi:DnaK suppressor protein